MTAVRLTELGEATVGLNDHHRPLVASAGSPPTGGLTIGNAVEPNFEALRHWCGFANLNCFQGIHPNSLWPTHLADTADPPPMIDIDFVDV